MINEIISDYISNINIIFFRKYLLKIKIGKFLIISFIYINHIYQILIDILMILNRNYR